MTSPERTLLDLAAVIAPRHLELALDEALRMGTVEPRALERLVERHRHRRGAPVLRALVGLGPEGIARTRSPLEARFLRFCHEEGLPLPVVNETVAGYEVDMLWPGTDVVVELDSYSFHRGRAAFDRDRAKWADLTAAGRKLIVVTERRLTRDRRTLAETLHALLG